MSNPFAKHVPSVFVVCSPFQALCAIATIKQLDIVKYKMISIFVKGNVRNTQLIAVLNKYNIKYISVSKLFNKHVSRLLKIINLVPKCFGYKRLFIGDFRNIAAHNYGFLFLANKADVVYLDDGNITISLLNNEIVEPLKDRSRKWLNFIERYRKIEYCKNLLTIYGDIPNPRYNVSQLSLDRIVEGNKDGKIEKDVYIVGTNVERFCKLKEIPENVYIQKLGELMYTLSQQYPDDTIYFIPHGREKLNYGEQLCEEYGCTFRRPEMTVELELLNMQNPPKAIYGYTSSALYNLKKLFPSAKVVNILFESPKDNPFYKGYVLISEYYQKNGIELIKESIL